MIKKPMLASAVEDLKDIRYPVLCTPKLDGIRCLVLNGKALSRSLKPIPNDHIRGILESSLFDGRILDGEIMIPGIPFNEISSAIMSKKGKPSFEYHVFDYINPDFLSFSYYGRTLKLGTALLPNFVIKVLPRQIDDESELLEYEAMCLAHGYEGIMLRHPEGPYKCGRSTLKEGYLLKLKRFQDAEARIIGFEELMINKNEKTVNELGHSERSSHKANLIPGDTLGALVVRNNEGIEFSIGTGFDAALRKLIWDNRDNYQDKLVTYKSQPTGVKDKPRFPVFKGFRHEDDL